MKKITSAIFALLTLLVLSACGTDVSVKQGLQLGKNNQAKYNVSPITYSQISGRVDPAIIARVESQLSGNLKDNNLLSTGPEAYKVTIDLQKYRTKNGSLRFFTGALSGEEYLESKVTVRDSRGNSVGEVVIYSHNVSALNTLASQHASAIYNFLVNKK
jgi:hypothetical protein